MNIQIDSTTATLLAGIGGAVAGAYVTYLGVIRVYKTRARDDAREELFRVFAPLLDFLLHDPSRSPFHDLGETAHEQRIAAQRLMRRLNWIEKFRFRRAWNDYIGIEYPASANTDDWISAFPHQYIEKTRDDLGRKNAYDLAVKRLRRIIKFSD